MMVRNWMRQPHDHRRHARVRGKPAQRKRLHALPVVDEGKLRGLVTRANLLRMGHFVLRTQDPDEFNFFVTRLKVKDIMVRNPATVEAGETMEQCLLRGRELGVAQFPVVDGEHVVGVISANETLASDPTAAPCSACTKTSTAAVRTTAGRRARTTGRRSRSTTDSGDGSGGKAGGTGGCISTIAFDGNRMAVDVCAGSGGVPGDRAGRNASSGAGRLTPVARAQSQARQQDAVLSRIGLTSPPDSPLQFPARPLSV